MTSVFLPITKGYLVKEGRSVTIQFALNDAADADALEATWNKALEKEACPSCRILWEQAHWDRKRHCKECRWPEILMERNRKRIQELQTKNAELLEKYPPVDE